MLRETFSNDLVNLSFHCGYDLKDKPDVQPLVKLKYQNTYYETNKELSLDYIWVHFSVISGNCVSCLLYFIINANDEKLIDITNYTGESIALMFDILEIINKSPLIGYKNRNGITIDYLNNLPFNDFRIYGTGSVQYFIRLYETPNSGWYSPLDTYSLNTRLEDHLNKLSLRVSSSTMESVPFRIMTYQNTNNDKISVSQIIYTANFTIHFNDHIFGMKFFNEHRQKNSKSITQFISSPINMEANTMLRNGMRLSSELFENTSSLALGTIVPYYRENHQPDNFLICDGRSCSGYELETLMSNTPDLRGKFIRMIGGNAGEIGVKQEDAIRNISGYFMIGDRNDLYGSSSNGHGCFKTTPSSGGWSMGEAHDQCKIEFDALVVLPTANENRPVNMAFNAIIYGGEKKLKSFLLNFLEVFAYVNAS